jgi:hypothetical protein
MQVFPQQSLPPLEDNGSQAESCQREFIKAPVDPRKYKTRICRNWEMNGFCPYEHTCVFAHGPEELRDLCTNHKLLASIGYFSNVVLLSMTNGIKPALPPHHLYDQPKMFPTPTSVEDFSRLMNSLPAGTSFPFQNPLPEVLKAMQQGNSSAEGAASWTASR